MGGLLVFRVSGTLTVEAGGSVTAAGLGFLGGAGLTGTGTSHGRQGESICGNPQTVSIQPNLGGGGGGKYMNTADDCGQGGGGAGHGVAGTWRPYSPTCFGTGNNAPAVNGGDTYGNPRAGIPPLKFADASLGVHWWTDRSTTYPATIALAATWDRDLAYRTGAAVGREVHSQAQLPFRRVEFRRAWDEGKGGLRGDPISAARRHAARGGGWRSPAAHSLRHAAWGSGLSDARFLERPVTRVDSAAQAAAPAWSGRPGQLPARASHRSGRARLTHPAPQDQVVAARR